MIGFSNLSMNEHNFYLCRLRSHHMGNSVGLCDYYINFVVRFLHRAFQCIDRWTSCLYDLCKCGCVAGWLTSSWLDFNISFGCWAAATLLFSFTALLFCSHDYFVSTYLRLVFFVRSFVRSILFLVCFMHHWIRKLFYLYAELIVLRLRRSHFSTSKQVKRFFSGMIAHQMIARTLVCASCVWFACMGTNRCIECSSATNLDVTWISTNFRNSSD